MKVSEISKNQLWWTIFTGVWVGIAIDRFVYAIFLEITKTLLK